EIQFFGHFGSLACHPSHCRIARLFVWGVSFCVPANVLEKFRIACVRAPMLGRLAPAHAKKYWRLTLGLVQSQCRTVPGIAPACCFLARLRANLVRSSII
ncbi:hypothetical protein HAX54_044271, partial [Datura stramonium]|nr:hypothetical protein [Datura stramonium]